MAFKIKHELQGGEVGAMLQKDPFEAGLALAALCSQLSGVREDDRARFAVQFHNGFRDWWRLNPQQQRESINVFMQLIPIQR